MIKPEEFRMPEGVRIIVAYPGVGKSKLTESSRAFIDLDRPDLKKDMAEYLRLINQSLAIPGTTVLLPSWQEMRDMLQSENLPYVLFWPSRDLKFDYNKRYVNRGSPKGLVDTLWWKWDEFHDSCEQDPTPYKVEMRQSQAYLSDYFL
uniref:ATP-binding protein n=1 Tax=Pseudomonas phage HRDY3 TaxID=3236930 RepID=A0AB39CDV1_9VIRU